MAKIKIKAARLPVPNKLAMADQVIAKGTNNANVPDNLPLLQDLGSKSSTLKASAEAVAAARLASKLATRQMKADEKAWTVSMNRQPHRERDERRCHEDPERRVRREKCADTAATA